MILTNLVAAVAARRMTSKKFRLFIDEGSVTVTVISHHAPQYHHQYQLHVKNI
jgi:hypothetical protein